MSENKICPCCKQIMPEEFSDTQEFIPAWEAETDPHDPRRNHPRVKKVISLMLRVDGKVVEAVTMDVSQGGARVFYLSDIIPVNAEVVVDCGDQVNLNGKAVTVWTDKSEKTYSVSGLRFMRDS